eukprot:3197366-Alexandrium_andersonii.AAC.1
MDTRRAMAGARQHASGIVVMVTCPPAALGPIATVQVCKCALAASLSNAAQATARATCAN